MNSRQLTAVDQVEARFPRKGIAASYPEFATCQGCTSLPHLIVQHLGFVPSPHNMRTGIDKRNIAGDVACAVADQKGRHRADIGNERRFVEW